MKKLFLFSAILLFALSLSSCSSDSASGTFLTFKINGAKKTFSHAFAVSSEGIVSVYAANGPLDAPTESATIAFMEGQTGTTDIFVSFTYENTAGETYEEDFENFMTNVTVNDGSKLKGEFSGNVIEISSSASATITEGRFSGNVLVGE